MSNIFINYSESDCPQGMDPKKWKELLKLENYRRKMIADREKTHTAHNIESFRN